MHAVEIIRELEFECDTHGQYLTENIDVKTFELKSKKQLEKEKRIPTTNSDSRNLYKTYEWGTKASES